MRWALDKLNGCGNHMNATNVCTGTQSIGNETDDAENGVKKTECDEQKRKHKTHLICRDQDDRAC